MQEPEKFLEKVFRGGMHAHAYLFFGPRGAGKKEAAHAFARLLAGHTDERRPNPDMLFIEPEEEDGDIAIDRVRGIASFLALAPAGGKMKVVIIGMAHRMQPEAASALLKTLEEPPAHSVLILISEHPGMLLPTILSRVQKVPFAKADVSPEIIDKRNEMFYHLKMVFESGVAERLTLAEKLAGGDVPVEEIFDCWLSLLHDLFYCSLSGCEVFVQNRSLVKELAKLAHEKQLTTERIRRALSTLVAARHTAQTTNANQRLLLENALLAL